MEALDYIELCRGYIPEQYKGSANLRGLVDCVLGQCQELETALWEVFRALDIDEAVGPALDFIGALVGVKRKLGEDDGAYRARIAAAIDLQGMPSTESIRQFLLLEFGQEIVGLYPDYPAGLYVVFDGEPGDVDLEAAETQVTSGVSLTRGTFLRVDEGYMNGAWIVSEDTGKPFVIDYHIPETLYDLVDSSGDDLVDSAGDDLEALDF